MNEKKNVVYSLLKGDSLEGVLATDYKEIDSNIKVPPSGLLFKGCKISARTVYKP